MARGNSYVYSSDEFWVYGGEDAVGDDFEVIGNDRGGDDVFYGEDDTYGYEVYGDAYYMDDRAKGGDDTFYGGEDVGSENPFDVIIGGEDIAFFAGDARFMAGGAVGGNDVAEGGNNSGTALFGDAVSAYERSVMGHDQLTGGDTFAYGGEDISTNLLIGDAYSFGDFRGGPVRILDVEDDDGYARAQVAGGHDVLLGGDAYSVYGAAYAINVMAGDAYSIGDESKGGADQVWGGDAQALDGYAAVINLMAGDALAIADESKGGNDRVAGGDAMADDGEAVALNLALGDGYALYGDVRAGNDVISGGNASVEDGGSAYAVNLLIGDTLMAVGDVKLGNDKLTGGDGGMGEDDAFVMNAVYGDIGDIEAIADMLDLGEDIPDGRLDLGDLFARGDDDMPATPFRMGSDTLEGGSGYAENLLVGDAGMLYGGTRGGNDDIKAGGAGSVNWMVGDADYIYEGGVGGRDILTAGAGEDHMWGDARYENDGFGGSDTFVLSKTAGVDFIYDFSVSEKDKINLKAFGLNFKSLQTRMEDSDGGVFIDLSFGETEAGVFIAGISVEELSARCFVF